MPEASTAPRERPLSPHLSVWRWHITMATSIMHRMSGVALYGVALIVTAWALSLAAGPDWYGCFLAVMGSVPGKIVQFLICLAIFYHLAKGVQHLVWDTGRALEVRTADAGAVAAIAFGIAASIAVFVIAGMMGAL